MISGCERGCSAGCSLAGLQRVTDSQRWLEQASASPSTVQAAVGSAEARLCPHLCDKTCCVRTPAVLLRFLLLLHFVPRASGRAFAQLAPQVSQPGQSSTLSQPLLQLTWLGRKQHEHHQLQWGAVLEHLLSAAGPAVSPTSDFQPSLQSPAPPFCWRL